MHTQVCLVGTVATDPKLTKSAGKASFCSFRLACNERRYDADKQEWVDTETSWFSINSFRGLADHAVSSFNKGDRIIVNGKLRVREWTNGEKSGTSAVIEADALGHDLRWGTSAFSRDTPTGVADQAEAATALASPVDARLGWPTPGSPGEGALVTSGLTASITSDETTVGVIARTDASVVDGADAAGVPCGSRESLAAADSGTSDASETEAASGDFKTDGFTPKQEYTVA